MSEHPPLTSAGPSPIDEGGTAARPGPLDGVLVADLSRVLAGPYCSMLLADLGATVIKVESPGGDETRSWVPPEHDGISTYYLSINRNKRSIVLDFGDADDLELVRELLRRADVTIENFKAGGLEKFGLDYESPRAEPSSSSTSRSAASAPQKVHGCRATTWSSRPCPA